MKTYEELEQENKELKETIDSMLKQRIKELEEKILERELTRVRIQAIYSVPVVSYNSHLLHDTLSYIP